MASIAGELGAVTVYHNTYVMDENQFNISSFDELAGHILVKNFRNGRCRLSQLEKILQAEQIIHLNGRIPKSEAIFDGSMLELVDDGSFVQLSKRGRDRFLYNGRLQETQFR